MSTDRLLREEQRATARRLTTRGDSARNIARFIGVSQRTIVRWRATDRAADRTNHNTATQEHTQS